jgi:AraC-like DNA-binding protein
MKKKGAAYRRMLISFVAVFSLPLCLTILFYLYSDRVTDSQLAQSDQSLISAIGSACDQEISRYQSILNYVAGNDTVQAMGERTESDPELETQLKTVLTQVAEVSSQEQTLFVCLPKLGLVFTSETDRVSQYSIFEYFGDVGAQMYQQTGFSAKRMSGKWGEDALFLTSSDGSSVMVGIVADPQMEAGISRESGYDWLLLNEDGDILRGDVALRTYQGRSTAVSRIDGWTYVLINTGDSFNSAFQIRLFFMVGLVICTLIGWLILEKVVLINYAPVEELMLPFKNKRSARKKNEFQFLQEQISTLISRQADMQNTISRSKSEMRKWHLSMMLAKPYIRQESDPEWQDLAGSFADQQNMVLLIRPKPQPQGPAVSERDEELRQFIIENVFTEKVGESFACHMTRIDGYQAMVVSDQDLANKQQKLWEIIYDTQVIVLENFQFQPVTASGGIHTGAEGLHASYLEAREAEEFVSVVEQDCVVYDSIRDNILRKYDYSVQAENRILSALQTGNAELAIAFIDKLLERNFAPNGATSNMRRCLLGDIYCTLLKAADEKGCIERIEVSYNSFGIEQPLDELRAKYALVVRSICQDTQPRAEISSDKELCLRIMDYIRENYADPKLNISQTALQFRMSPTALSTMFKSEMGKSLLKAINEVRAEHATEFLRQGFSVSETAEKVGITESSSFIRLYRKEMGITPGQMKTHLKNENT